MGSIPTGGTKLYYVGSPLRLESRRVRLALLIHKTSKVGSRDWKNNQIAECPGKMMLDSL